MKIQSLIICFISFFSICFSAEIKTHKELIPFEEGALFKKETFIEEEGSFISLFRTDLMIFNQEMKPLKVIVLDAGGRALSLEVMEYNQEKELVKKTVYGNLSGQSTGAFFLDSAYNLINSEVESYTISYTYEKGKLTSFQEDNGKGYRYQYDRLGRKIAEFLCNGDEILQRSFMIYSEEGEFLKQIVDDGDSESLDSLSGVTERKIFATLKEGDKRFTEESYLDLTTLKEHKVEKREYQFTENGELSLQTVSSEDGEVVYSAYQEHDQNGHLLSTVNTKGEAAGFSFDLDGKLVLGASTDGKSFNLWEKKQEEYYRFENSVTKIYSREGKLLKTVDSYLQETHYFYDLFGRLQRITFPQVLNEEGEKIEPQIEYEYDLFGRVLSMRDLDGEKTLYRYTLRGDLAEIHHPNNRVDKYTYNLDGTLKEIQTADGLKKCYQYDKFFHRTHELFLDREGAVIGSNQKTYNVSRLLKESNHLGDATEYRYDFRGLLQEVLSFEGGTLSSHQKLQYDAKKQLLNVTDLNLDAEEHSRVTTFERDEAGVLKNLRLESLSGEVLYQKSEETQKKAKVPLILSDSAVKDDLLGFVREVISQENKETVTRTLFDTFERPVNVQKRSLNGTLLSDLSYRYTLKGKKAEEKVALIENGEILSFLTNRWKYLPSGELEKVIYNKNSLDEASTSYTYDAFGKLETIIKPDGVVLYYFYNAEGNVEKLTSSDSSINYQFSYDSLGRITEALDNLFHQDIERRYNRLNKAVEEHLGENKAPFLFSYDSLGRRKNFTLPDGSSIGYNYDPAYLRSIERFSKEKESLYSHNYLKYDENGRLLVSKMIKNVGEIERKFNGQELSLIDTPYWKASIPKEGYDENGNIQQMTTSDLLGIVDHHYSYDPLERLVKEVNHTESSFTYDSLSNQERSGDLYDKNKNQLIIQGDTHYEYDLNGNLIRKKSKESEIFYRYDALNRLTAAVKEKDFSIVYQYDAFNRCLKESHFKWNGKTLELSEEKNHLYDGLNEIGSMTPSFKIEELRVLGIGLGAEVGSSVAIELEKTKKQILAPIHDQRGSLACLIDTKSLEILEGYRYTAFGEELIYDSDGKILTESAVDNPWRFSSKRTESKTHLVHFGYRVYDPITHRWMTKDPLANYDGPNPYAFLQNNPLNQVDHYGLFTWSHLFEMLSTTTSDFYQYLNQKIKSPSVQLLQTLGDLGFTRENFEEFLTYIFGKTRFIMMGFHHEMLQTGVVGKGEVSDKVRLTYIGGILTALEEFIVQSQMISDTHGGNNLHYVYRPTYGWTRDLLQSAQVKCLGLITPQAYILAEKWKALIEEMGGINNGGLIIHYAHSIGGGDSYRARQLLLPEEIKMLRIHTFGSPLLIPNDGFESVTNHVSLQDGVPFLDLFEMVLAFYYEASHVNFLNAENGFFLIFDHFFTNETYKNIWEKLGEEFISEYGKIE